MLWGKHGGSFQSSQIVCIRLASFTFNDYTLCVLKVLHGDKIWWWKDLQFFIRIDHWHFTRQRKNIHSSGTKVMMEKIPMVVQMIHIVHARKIHASWISWIMNVILQNVMCVDSVLIANICLFMASLRSFSQCGPPKMTLMAAKCGYKNIETHTAHSIVSWPNPKQWIIVHTSDLMMMMIRQSVYSLNHHKGNG